MVGNIWWGTLGTTSRDENMLGPPNGTKSHPIGLGAFSMVLGYILS